MIRILGVDVGTVRVGVALSDPLGITAQPLEVIDRRRVDAQARLAELIAEYEVQQVVVGKPLHLHGDFGAAAEAAQAFAEELGRKTGVPVELWDERLSTAEAQRVMIAGGARRERRRENIDKVAAALILQSYLDAHASPPGDVEE